MSSVFCSALIASLAFSQVFAADVRLHLPKSFNGKLQSDSILSFDQVEQTLSNIAGVSSLRNYGSIQVKDSNAPKAHLVVAANGFPDSSFPELEMYQVRKEYEVKNAAMLWKMLRGDDFDDESQPASVIDLFNQANPGSLQLSLSASSDFLNAISVHRELIPGSNAVSILLNPKSSTTSTLNTNKVCSALASIINPEEVKTVNTNVFGEKFDTEITSNRNFLAEFTAISKLKNLIQTDPKLIKLVQDDIPDYYTIAISSLAELRSIYGDDSEQYKLALSETEKLIEELRQVISTAYNGQVSTQVISFEGEEPLPIIETKQHKKRDAYDVAAPCYETFELCQNTTSNCTGGQGNCTLIKSSGTTDCYRCLCSVQYAGDSCEFIDKSAPFHTMFWTSLAIVITLILVSMSLAYMDPGTDTLLFRTGSHRPKTD